MARAPQSGWGSAPQSGNLTRQFIDVAKKHLGEIPERGGVSRLELVGIVDCLIATDPNVIRPVSKVLGQFSVFGHPSQSRSHEHFGGVGHHFLRRNIQRRTIHSGSRVPTLAMKGLLPFYKSPADGLGAMHWCANLRGLGPARNYKILVCHGARHLGRPDRPAHIFYGGKTNRRRTVSACCKTVVHCIAEVFRARRKHNLKGNLFGPAMRATGSEYSHV